MVALNNVKAMASDPRLQRSNRDIRDAVKMWTSNRTEAERLYGDISDWDVSDVTDMSELFKGKDKFNDDISRWDVSNVTDTSSMFHSARAFNRPVGN
jgi:surface protein